MHPDEEQTNILTQGSKALLNRKTLRSFSTFFFSLISTYDNNKLSYETKND